MARGSSIAWSVAALGAGLLCRGCLYPDYVVRDLGTDASANGGSGQGGTGGASTGGSSNGGASTGGAANGGADASVGGNSNGGTDASAGGIANGGADASLGGSSSGGTGGAGTGGTASGGGGTSTGGNASGGADASTGGSATGGSGTGGVTTTGGVTGTGGGTPCDSGIDGCVSFPEVCNNAIDDDKDGLTDCDDSDCAIAASCAGRCTSAASMSCNTPLVGQRTDGVGSTSRIGPPDYSCTSGSYPGPERAHRLFPTAGQTVFLEGYGFDADLGLFLVAVNSGLSCDATLACNAASDVTGLNPEVLKFTAAANKDYYVIVDGASAGSYSLVARCAASHLCNPTIGIRAGQTVSGTTSASAPNVTQALAQDAATEYSCRSIIQSGPEATYMFTPTTTGSYRVDLTNLSGNVSLFVVAGPTCGTTCVDASSFSISASTQPESITFSGIADTTYYVVIDSFNFTPVTFDVSVTAL